MEEIEVKFPLIDYLFNLGDFEYRQIFENIKYPWSALDNLEDYIKTFLKRKKEIFIAANVKIDKTARIEGSVIIGNNTIVGYQAYLRGPVIIGKNCYIGRSEIKRSILLNSVSVAHFNYLGDSIVGNKVNFGAGVKVANLKLDGQPIIVKYKNQKIKTNLKKLGSLIGDGCQIGCNSVLNPGTILGRKCLIYPLLNVKSKFYKNSSKLKL